MRVNQVQRPLLCPIPVQWLFQIIGVDIMALPKTSQGNHHVLVLQDLNPPSTRHCCTLWAGFHELMNIWSMALASEDSEMRLRHHLLPWQMVLAHEDYVIMHSHNYIPQMIVDLQFPHSLSIHLHPPPRVGSF